MSDTTTRHYEDPHRAGWCAGCGCAFPCPGTVTGAGVDTTLWAWA